MTMLIRLVGMYRPTFILSKIIGYLDDIHIWPCGQFLRMFTIQTILFTNHYLWNMEVFSRKCSLISLQLLGLRKELFHPERTMARSKRQCEETIDLMLKLLKEVLRAIQNEEGSDVNVVDAVDGGINYIQQVCNT